MLRNAKRMARVEAERARQEDSERLKLRKQPEKHWKALISVRNRGRWLAERSIHRSVTPRKDLDSTFERLYKASKLKPHDFKIFLKL